VDIIMDNTDSSQQFSPAEVKNIWQQMCAKLQPEITSSNYGTWVLANPVTEILYIDQNKLIATVTSPTAFHATNFKKNFDQIVSQSLGEITGKEVQIEYKIGNPNIRSEIPHPNQSSYIPDTANYNRSPQSPLQDTYDSPITNKQQIPETSVSTQPANSAFSFGPLTSTMSPRVEQLFSEATLSASSVDHEMAIAQNIGMRRDYTFSTFAVSTTNEMAHAAATAVSNRPGSSYNPLFLYGGVGVGKTHLMHAIGNNILHNNLQVRIIYCTGEEFTNEIVQAIQNKKATAFKNKYRNCDVLLIDDIQFIAGKNAVQEEFFHTFNAITQQSKQVVMTSDRPPQEIRLLEDRLRSRFEAGLMIDIGQPSFELRTAILLIKAKAAQLNIPIELAKTVAAKVDSARRIEGIIKKIPEILKIEEPENKQQIRVSPIEVIKSVSNHFRLKQSELKGNKRLKHIVTARHITMYLMKKELQMPLADIGKWFSNRDHTSVLHAVRKVELDIVQKPDLHQEVSALVTTLRMISR